MKKILTACLVICIGFAFLSGCKRTSETGGSRTSETESSKPIKIGYYSFAATMGFYKEMYEGMEAACKAKGYELIPVFTDADPVKMRSAYDQFKTMGVDIIIDANSIADVVKPFAEDALEDKIPYISLFVSYPEPLYTFGPSNSDMGNAVGTYIGELIKKEWNGKIDGIILCGSFTDAPDITERLTTAVPALGEIINVEGKEVIQVDAFSDQALIFQRVTNTLAANPNKKFAMFCQNDDVANASFSAVESAGRGGDVMGTGSDCIEIALQCFKEAIDSGNLTVPWRGSIFFDTMDWSRQIVEMAEKLIHSEPCPYSIVAPASVCGIYNLYQYHPELRD
jgi:ABC-type sugar transport system substrate-binding protein